MAKRKPFKSITDQVSILRTRGLIFPDNGEHFEFLKRNSYYRFSGYLRYFQVAPSRGDETFWHSTTFSEVRALYEADLQLRSFLLHALQMIEVSARAAFSHSEAQLHSPYSSYLARDAYLAPPASHHKHTEELIFSDIRRSEELFIKRHRTGDWQHTISWMDNIPVWAAAETFSFGTLSKALAYRNDEKQVYKAACAILGVGNSDLDGQLRSFVHLRNKCAHYSRLWNAATHDQPTVQGKIKSKAKKKLDGQYDGNSIFAVIVAMDDFMSKAGLHENFLDDFLTRFKQNSVYLNGLTHPRKP